MACCGGRGTRAKPVKNTTIVTESVHNEPLSATDVRLSYVGNNTGRETIYGPTGRRYKYGRTARYLYLWVDKDDLAFMLDTKMFKPAPLPTAPVVAVEVQAQEVVQSEPVVETAPVETPEQEERESITLDPGALTVSALMALPTENMDVQGLLAAELAGKARRSAIAYLEGLLEDADATA